MPWARLFRQYEVDPEIRSFGLSLTSLLECIQFLVQTEQSQAGGTIELRIGSLEDGLQLQCVPSPEVWATVLRGFLAQEWTTYFTGRMGGGQDASQ